MSTGIVDGEDLFLNVDFYLNDFISTSQTTNDQNTYLNNNWNDTDAMNEMESNFFDSSMPCLKSPIAIKPTSCEFGHDGAFLSVCGFELDDTFTSEDRWPI